MRTLGKIALYKGREYEFIAKHIYAEFVFLDFYSL